MSLTCDLILSDPKQPMLCYSHNSFSAGMRTFHSVAAQTPQLGKTAGSVQVLGRRGAEWEAGNMSLKLLTPMKSAKEAWSYSLVCSPRARWQLEAHARRLTARLL